MTPDRPMSTSMENMEVMPSINIDELISEAIKISQVMIKMVK
jgi:hypothetical protein